jgi:hypothetical protein
MLRPSTGQLPANAAGPAGFDEFFDNPNTIPRELAGLKGIFRPVSVKATSVGDRVELLFHGLKLGIFEGGIAYHVLSGSRLVHQEAVVSTQEANTAYLYETDCGSPHRLKRSDPGGGR